MKEFLTSPITKTTSRIALVIFIVLSTLMCVYRFKTYTYLTVVFNEARPVRNKIPVYYKGYRIGKVEKIKPSNDFKSTMVTIVLYPKHLKLPINTTALLTREKRERREIDFINLIYPDEPSDISLRSGDRINGFTTVDIESYFSTKAISGDLDKITNNVNELIESLNATSKALTMLMDVLTETVNENRPSIKIMTGNLAKMSDSLRIFAYKLNISINERQLQNTFTNFDKTSSNAVITTGNLDGITRNINIFTDDLNKNSPEISKTISNAEMITGNIAEITNGVKNTLSQNFGGLRLIFGKPVKNNCYKNCNPCRQCK